MITVSESTKRPNNFFFKVLWSKTFFAIAVDEIHAKKFTIPLTSYYYWPREDSWRLLKDDLDNKPLISEEFKMEILNQYTVLINYWILNSRKNISRARIKKECNEISLEMIAYI
jgi:30S ribosomal protein 3